MRPICSLTSEMVPCGSVVMSASMIDSIAVSGSDGVARASVRVTGGDSVDVVAAPVLAPQRSVRFRLAGAPGPVTEA